MVPFVMAGQTLLYLFQKPAKTFVLQGVFAPFHHPMGR